MEETLSPDEADEEDEEEEQSEEDVLSSPGEDESPTKAKEKKIEGIVPKDIE